MNEERNNPFASQIEDIERLQAYKKLQKKNIIWMIVGSVVGAMIGIPACQDAPVAAVFIICFVGTLKSNLSFIFRKLEDGGDGDALMKVLKFIGSLIASPVFLVYRFVQSIKAINETKKAVTAMTAMMQEIEELLSKGEKPDSDGIKNKIAELKAYQHKVRESHNAARMRQLPHYNAYLDLVDALKENGCEVNEFENKNKIVRSSVSLEGEHLGEVLAVAPPPSGEYKMVKEWGEFGNSILSFGPSSGCYVAVFINNPKNGISAGQQKFVSFVENFLAEGFSRGK